MYVLAFEKSSQTRVSSDSSAASLSLLTKCAGYLRLRHASAIFAPRSRPRDSRSLVLVDRGDYVGFVEFDDEAFVGLGGSFRLVSFRGGLEDRIEE